ncbi:choice-of-anchor J domain-containing protein, partial [bacterium]|nr:choice-of-anchor J domain-containing protein [bacterium]
EGDYSGSFEVLSNDTAIPSLTVNTTAFILPPLPDNISIIGNGVLTNQGLPFEPFYRHTWSQSIYYAGEIGIADQRVEKISWHYNGNSAWGPDDMKIYMGLTSEISFTGNTDWISLDSMMEVFNGAITVPAEDGWVEIELNIPFIYDNTQNLVVGVFHTVPSYHSSADEFFCTASDATRSILYYSDSVIPDPAAPPTANYMRNSFPNVILEFGDIPNAPDLTVYPTNSIFDMTPVDGTSDEKSITMRSIGLQDVTVADAPTITGAHADQFTITTDSNAYPLVLPFNQLATIGVSFTPNSEGSKSATIQIIDNATRETHLVNISGYAYADDGNDIPTTATTLTLPVDGDTYAIMPIGDIDWYKIPAMGISDTLICSVANADGSSVNPSMWLYGPATDPNDINTSTSLANGTSINFVLPQSGDYYLRVAKSTNYPAGVTPPHTRKSENGEAARLTRDDTGLYTLNVDANYNYDFNSPLNLEATNQSGYVELTWVEPPYERYLIGYHVYRNNSAITEEMIPIGTNLYHDANVVVGTEYSYHVIGMFEEPDGFSLPSNTATIIYYNLGEPLWGDDFEDHPDFTLNMPNWIQYDVDGGGTYTISNVDYDNAGEPMSYMVFNPSATVPPIEDMIPQSGDKFLTSFASTEGENDDWIITPRFTVGTTSVVSFYAKSYTAEFGLEKFRVKMSLGGDQVSNFQYSLHQGIDYLEAPTEWTLYHFNVSDITGTTVRFGVQCVSSDAFIFMLDNFRIDSTPDGVDNENVDIIPQANSLAQNYPNPFNPETSIAFTTKEAGNVIIDVYNIKGQKVKTLLNDHRNAGEHSVVWNGKDENNRNVASGVYFYRMKNGKFNSTKKMILMK